MTSIPLSLKHKRIIEGIPSVGESAHVYLYTVKSKLDAEYISILDHLIGMSDTTLSKWLNITPRTFRNYKNNSALVLKDNIKEHIILILSLYKHGIEVFGSVENFEKWLMEKNPLLDHQAPSDFLETISGITFIDDRLTAMEYGENV
ncbi:antitoxin Xre/MbcA/ParS toxin-binding domain-containing protein [Leadbetterella byssophila]|uniref:Uncharacterized protein n=1 Tax=Leadbetterella byssophila (strain DSM 17132 / JCM 16389 / KACC 11308 / NBRC 106382 / 4M15) TaxID=649349 RepID=E4RZE4_LEAB4|nr:antitoxin Xre/MbcA/ParS toxin-binding domain-containing protein [Leadbetterella byssophila]ADQ16483.1 hypothetical protein Lbys_0722 [Leadbetterella byssophila DSM 17132]